MTQIRVRYIYKAEDRPALLTQFGWVKKITPRSIVVAPDFEDCLLIFSTKTFLDKTQESQNADIYFRKDATGLVRTESGKNL